VTASASTTGVGVRIAGVGIVAVGFLDGGEPLEGAVAGGAVRGTAQALNAVAATMEMSMSMLARLTLFIARDLLGTLR
jgi:hypothetical protein